MHFFSNTKSSIATFVALVAICLPWNVVVNASPYIISDDRVRSLDITPVLGRGYSIMTNTYQSTCIDVEETTVPSYNYDYSFHDFTKTTDLDTDMADAMSYSFGYWWYKGNLDYTSSSTTKVETQNFVVTSTMRIERYYASLKEEVSPMNSAAQELLNRQDYVGFFKACGPNYIRGIRRAQEVTAIFNFFASSSDNASQFAYNLQVSSGWWDFEYQSSWANSSKFAALTASLKIKILGFGMGLNQEGSETLVATSLQDYMRVMKFAFNTMTKNKDSVHIGMVYGMEVVPWVNNIQFQLESGIQDESLEVPLARSLIPRAYRRSDPSDKDFNNNQRDDFRCKEQAYEMDKYGYCCEDDALYDYVEQTYDADEPETKVCRPLRVLDKAIVTENMVSNGEFVARLDRIVRLKLNQLSTMEKCISAARAIPERFDFNILKPQDTVLYDAAIDFKLTVFELKMALDPFNDYSVIRHMAAELDEFMEMFYQPCIAALFGTNVGLSADTEASYFMAYPWYTHKECSYLSCLGTSMRWNRGGEGGCVPSLITGLDSGEYNAADDSNCKKSSVTSNYQDSCEYQSNELYQYREKINAGWEATIPRGRVDYFMEHFCLPQITDVVLTADGIYTKMKGYSEKITKTNSVNVALGKNAYQSSTYLNGVASRAVDGNTNPRWRYGGITHTSYTTNPWWYVDLGDDYTIKKVVVFNRVDCCSERLSDFKLTIYNDDIIVFTRTFPGIPPQKKEIDVKALASTDVIGDKVEIQIFRTDYLSIAEVEVWNEF